MGQAGRDRGMIYFITARDVGMVKIGFAHNPQARFHVVQTGSPIELKLERAGDGSYSDEDELHSRFERLRVRGEWYRLTPEIENLMGEYPVYVWRHRGCQHASRKRPTQDVSAQPAA